MSMLLTATPYGTDAEVSKTGPSLVLSKLTGGYKLPGIVNNKAASYMY